MFLQLLTDYAELMADPLTNVLNTAFSFEIWPEVWWTEMVTVIPKCPKPDGLGDTRNISCTPVFSKIREHFLRERLRKEGKVRSNQYGGLSGSSTSHYLANAWTDVMEALDQDGGVANLLSINFAKAFNTMEHQSCLSAIKQKGASDHVIRMTAAFLMGRRMVFKAGGAKSSSRLLRGGAPQGTLMGNYLFILTTDHIEEKRNAAVSEIMTALQNLQIDRANPAFDIMAAAAAKETPIKRRGILPATDHLSFSTPTGRGQFQPFEPSSPESDDDGDSFTYLRGNVRRPIFRIDDSNNSASQISLTAEELNEHHPRPTHWKDMDLSTYKYVDDFLSCEKSWLGNAYKIFGQSKQHAVIYAQKCKELFINVKTNAEQVGMRVNEGKTKLLCISPATRSEVTSYKRLTDGTKVQSQSELKQLGFTFSLRPTVDLHLDKTARKFRSRLWFLRHLKNANVEAKDLVHVYKCFLVPILDYACMVYHPLLTKQQADGLERLQSAAMKIIFGWTESYADILRSNNIEYLAERRQRVMDKFILKTASNDKFNESWFPTKTFVHHDLSWENIIRDSLQKRKDCTTRCYIIIDAD